MDFQKSLGRKVFPIQLKTEIIWAVILNVSLGKKYLYVPYGPSQAEGSAQLKTELEIIAKKEGAIFIKIEPQQDEVVQALINLGFRFNPITVQPHRTLILDLTKSESQLNQEMHQKTRYSIRVAERHGLKFKILSEDTKQSWPIYEKTSRRQNFGIYPREYYQALLDCKDLNTFQAGVFKGEKIIATGIFLIYRKEGFYLHGGSDYKEHALMAPYLLHWSIIKHLKECGVQRYDLWGVDSEAYPGVTRFKLRWGGQVIEYPGAFDLPLNRFWYRVYNLYKKFR